MVPEEESEGLSPEAREEAERMERDKETLEQIWAQAVEMRKEVDHTLGPQNPSTSLMKVAEQYRKIPEKSSQMEALYLYGTALARDSYQLHMEKGSLTLDLAHEEAEDALQESIETSKQALAQITKDWGKEAVEGAGGSISSFKSHIEQIAANPKLRSSLMSLESIFQGLLKMRDATSQQLNLLAKEIDISNPDDRKMEERILREWQKRQKKFSESVETLAKKLDLPKELLTTFQESDLKMGRS